MARPASKFVEPLSQVNREHLKQVWREHPTYVVRCRAHAILLSSQGYTISQLQEIFQISRPTALAWIERWEQYGIDGLEDEPRSGAPPVLNEHEREPLKELLKRFPRQPKIVIRELERRTGKIISRSTLRRWARRLGLRWKRFRRRKKPEPDPNRFRLAQEDIELFQSSPDLEVAYFDESAFSLQGVVPYGWQPEDERYEIPVGPEHGNIQVLGIEEEDGSVYGYLHRGRVVGKTVVEVIEDYSQRIPRNTVLILDRASVHTCELVAEHIETWNDRGLFLYFLPPQSQELNDIERLWKRLKYQELPIDSWESFTSLVTDRETSPRRKRRSRSHSWVSPFSEGIHFLPPA